MPRAVATPLDKGTGPKLVNDSFHPPSWQSYVTFFKPIETDNLKLQASKQSL